MEPLLFMVIFFFIINLILLGPRKKIATSVGAEPIPEEDRFSEEPEFINVLENDLNPAFERTKVNRMTSRSHEEDSVPNSPIGNNLLVKIFFLKILNISNQIYNF